MTITLYHHRGACSLAPLIALHEAGLDFELNIINLAGDRSRYLKVNPAGRVPALTIGDELLTENVAILFRIAALAREARLFPEDVGPASQMLSLMSWLGSTLHILRRQVSLPSRFTPDSEAQARLVEVGRPKMWEAMLELDRRLGASAWFGGDAFSVADGYALVFYDWALADDFPVRDLPSLSAWASRMLARPSVRAALREHAGPLHAQVLEEDLS